MGLNWAGSLICPIFQYEYCTLLSDFDRICGCGTVGTGGTAFVEEP